MLHAILHCVCYDMQYYLFQSIKLKLALSFLSFKSK
jgi:hypothetical protein